MELKASKPGWWDSQKGCRVRAWTLDSSRHNGLFSSIRLNYIEGTKMLAAYLYEVSQL